MSVISEALEKIQSAVYGNEVRGSIVTAIRECYDDVEEGRTTAEKATEDLEELKDKIDSALVTEQEFVNTLNGTGGEDRGLIYDVRQQGYKADSVAREVQKAFQNMHIKMVVTEPNTNGDIDVVKNLLTGYPDTVTFHVPRGLQGPAGSFSEEDAAPIADSEHLGCVKVGAGLKMVGLGNDTLTLSVLQDGALSVMNGLLMANMATANSRGVVRVGAGLSVSSGSGTVSVKTGKGLSIDERGYLNADMERELELTHKMIFIGDSYAVGRPDNIDGWQIKLATMLGLDFNPTNVSDPGYPHIFIGASGSGFIAKSNGNSDVTASPQGYTWEAGLNWRELLERRSLTMTDSEKAEVSCIIVAGGANDFNDMSNANLPTEGEILEEIRLFAELISNTFPNAKTYIAFCGRRPGVRSSFGRAQSAYTKSVLYGVNYITGGELWIANNAYINNVESAACHPTSYGQEEIARGLLFGLKGLSYVPSCSYSSTVLSNEYGDKWYLGWYVRGNLINIYSKGFVSMEKNPNKYSTGGTTRFATFTSSNDTNMPIISSDPSSYYNPTGTDAQKLTYNFGWLDVPCILRNSTDASSWRNANVRLKFTRHGIEVYPYAVVGSGGFFKDAVISRLDIPPFERTIMQVY